MKRLMIVLTVVVCMAMLVGSGSERVVFSQSPGSGDELISAVVILRSASGASLIQDAEELLKINKVLTVKEAREIVKRYEPRPEDIKQAEKLLKEEGFEIIISDNLFISIAGPRSKFIEKLGVIPVKQEKKVYFGNTEKRVTYYEKEAPISILSVTPGLRELVETVTFPPPPDFFGDISPDPPDVEGLDLQEVRDLVHANAVHALGITGKGITVAVLDSGFADHSYFIERGYHVKKYYYSTLRRVLDVFRGDKEGHGTAVASNIFAVAPDISLVSIQTRGDWLTMRDTDPQIAGFQIADREGADVINLSWGYDEDKVLAEPDKYVTVKQEIVNAISRATIVVCSSGNGVESGWTSGRAWPASMPSAISVGGVSEHRHVVGNTDQKGSSSFPSAIYTDPARHVPDVVAVFGNIIAPTQPNSDLDKESEAGDGTAPDDGWLVAGGTSFAAPQVAGIAALLKQKNPSLTQEQAKEILTQSALDVTEGCSALDDSNGGPYEDECASIGRPDNASGWGMVSAIRALNYNAIPINKGWSLIGLTKEHSYTYMASDLLHELNDQEGSCTHVSIYDNGMWQTYVERGGIPYADDFPLALGQGIFIKCGNHIDGWNESGDSFPLEPIALNLDLGWNLISVPYSTKTYTARYLLTGAMGGIGDNNCTTVVKWKAGRYDSYVFDYAEYMGYGRDFYIEPGHGYFVRCTESTNWTPSSVPLDNTMHNVHLPSHSPRNTFAIMETVDKNNKLERIAQHAVAESISRHKVTNVTDNGFAVSWITDEPEMGYLLVGTTPDALNFIAYDDRGEATSATTHHFSIRALTPDTTYYYDIVSGSILDNNNGGHYNVTTGPNLGQPTNNYRAYGEIFRNSSTDIAEDSIVYITLENSDNGILSSEMSFPMSEGLEGYADVLDNARTTDYNQFFSGANRVQMYAEGGTEGIASQIIDLAAAQPAPDLTLSIAAPNTPMLISPSPGEYIEDFNPTLTFSTTDNTGSPLYYRIELSTDKFETIVKAFDQRTDTTGWSAESYSSEETARYTIQLTDTLQNVTIYQWRVNAFNGTAWSPTSEMGAFAVAKYWEIYLPIIMKNFDISLVPTPTDTPTPSTTPTDTPTPTPTPTSTPPTESPICYVKVEGSRKIYCMNGDGSGERFIRSGDDPRLSPNGQQIVFYESSTVKKMNIDGSSVTSLASGRNPSWSPDGSKIVYMNGYKLFTMNADGSGQTALPSESGRYDWNPDWSPDGTQIIFTSGPAAGNTDGIWIMNVDGTNRHRLRDYGWYPAWSPDGTEIAFQWQNLRVMNADGSNPREVAGNRDQYAWPAWLSNDWLIYVVDNNIHRVRADGTADQQLTNDGTHEYRSLTARTFN